jgi:hypothetical protein
LRLARCGEQRRKLLLRRHAEPAGRVHRVPVSRACPATVAHMVIS